MGGAGKGGDKCAWGVHVICSGVWVYIYISGLVTPLSLLS